MNTQIEDRLKNDKILSLLNGLSAVATNGGLNESTKELKENLQGTIMKEVGNTKDIIDKSQDKINESVETLKTTIEEAESKNL